MELDWFNVFFRLNDSYSSNGTQAGPPVAELPQYVAMRLCSFTALGHDTAACNPRLYDDCPSLEYLDLGWFSTPEASSHPEEACRVYNHGEGAGKVGRVNRYVIPPD